MKTIYLFLLIGLLSTTGLHAQKNIASATVSFEFVSKKVDGTIGGFESTSSIDLENPTNSKFSGSVAVKTIKTGAFLRDWALKARKYFNEDDYPRIHFESTKINILGDVFSVKGELSIKGTTKTITIPFTRKDGQLKGTFTIYSSDYGIHIKKDREDNKVVIQLVLDLK